MKDQHLQQAAVLPLSQHVDNIMITSTEQLHHHNYVRCDQFHISFPPYQQCSAVSFQYLPDYTRCFHVVRLEAFQFSHKH